jgi:hypothetical protein
MTLAPAPAVPFALLGRALGFSAEAMEVALYHRYCQALPWASATRPGSGGPFWALPLIEMSFLLSNLLSYSLSRLLLPVKSSYAYSLQ